MSVTAAFVRQLGSQPGVQLNPLQDGSDIPAFDIVDRVFAMPGRFTRGRVDRAFKVHKGNVKAKLGKGELMRTSALNEAWVQLVEALNNGAYEAVVSRLVADDYVIRWALATPDDVLEDSAGNPITDGEDPIVTGDGVGWYTSHHAAILTPTVSGGKITAVSVVPGFDYDESEEIVINGAGTGATLTPVFGQPGVLTSVTVPVGGTGTGYAQNTTSLACIPNAAEPQVSYLFALKHRDCHNDGIKLSYHAEKVRDGAGILSANSEITLRVLDSDDAVLHEFVGSLSPTAADSYGNSYYLPDVVSRQTDAVELLVSSTFTTVATTSPAYGYDANGRAKWSTSPLLSCFDEGSLLYAEDGSDYQAAVDRLKNAQYGFGYIASGGTQAGALLIKLIALAYDVNRIFRFDIPGNLDVLGAISFIDDDLGITNDTGHLVQAFWAPIKTLDPTGLNPRGYFGTSALNIAYACKRNSVVDSKGFAKKNYPIAGKNWPLSRAGCLQTTTPTEQDLSELASRRIVPVIYDTFSNGGAYVFSDSLTMAPVTNSLKKLAAVADMSTSIDAYVTVLCKDYLQLPMQIFVKRVTDDLKRLFEGAESAGWLVPSRDPEMEGAAWRLEVKPSEARPYDLCLVSYWLSYDGTVRQVHVTQTLMR